MKFSVKKGSLEDFSAGYFILPVSAKGFSSEKKAFSTELRKVVEREVRRRKFELKPARRITLSIPPPKKSKKTQPSPSYLRLSTLSENASKATTDSLDEWRKLGGDAVRNARREGFTAAYILAPNLPSTNMKEVVQAITEGAGLADYNFTRLKGPGNKKPASPFTTNILLKRPPSKKAREGLQAGKVMAESISLARDLVNLPAGHLLPKDLVKTVRNISKKTGRLSVTVYNKQALKKMGANAIIGVSQGSSSQPYLIHLRLRASTKGSKLGPIVLVGKGITFDSGGLSIKTGPGMATMKSDMAGAAAVIGAMNMFAEMGTKINRPRELHALIPTCENLVDSHSLRPGDVVTALNKKTIEVLNTDAEGRLILADALSFSSRLKPSTIIDAATLTGACVSALGPEIAGIFSNHEDLRNQIILTGEACGEKFWPLPLDEIYRPLIDSRIADLRNIGSDSPGATTAALFLKEFVPKDARWAHLDIAGPSFLSKEHEYRKSGGTGFGVRTLVRLLEHLS